MLRIISLQAQTRYTIYLIARNAIGYTTAQYDIRTLRPSNGAIFSLGLKEPVDPDTLLKALELALRISKDRLLLVTNYTKVK